SSAPPPSPARADWARCGPVWSPWAAAGPARPRAAQRVSAVTASAAKGRMAAQRAVASAVTEWRVRRQAAAGETAPGSGGLHLLHRGGLEVEQRSLGGRQLVVLLGESS